MQDPTRPDVAVIAQASIGDEGYQRAKSKLRDAQSAAKVGGTGSGEHDRAKLSTARFFQQRAQKYEHRSNQERRQQVGNRERRSGLKGHGPYAFRVNFCGDRTYHSVVGENAAPHAAEWTPTMRAASKQPSVRPRQ